MQIEDLLLGSTAPNVRLLANAYFLDIMSRDRRERERKIFARGENILSRPRPETTGKKGKGILSAGDVIFESGGDKCAMRSLLSLPVSVRTGIGVPKGRSEIRVSLARGDTKRRRSKIFASLGCLRLRHRLFPRYNVPRYANHDQIRPRRGKVVQGYTEGYASPSS